MKNKLIGKKIHLFPNDTYEKFAVVDDVDEYGFYFTITKCHERSGHKIGEKLFYSHSSGVTMKFVD